jgi:hypothetical protein
MTASLIGPDGQPSATAEAIDRINMVFNALFAVELALNLYSHWLLEFFRNPWSVLDLLVVVLSLLTLGLPISALRLIRAFRVIRLFGRLGALKKIVTALSASIVPMLNAFLILFVILSICKLSFSAKSKFSFRPCITFTHLPKLMTASARRHPGRLGLRRHCTGRLRGLRPGIHDGACAARAEIIHVIVLHNYS